MADLSTHLPRTKPSLTSLIRKSSMPSHWFLIHRQLPLRGRRIRWTRRWTTQRRPFLHTHPIALPSQNQWFSALFHQWNHLGGFIGALMPRLSPRSFVSKCWWWGPGISSILMIVVFKFGRTLKMSWEALKILIPGTTQQFWLMDVGCSLGSADFKISPSESNAEPRLKTDALMIFFFQIF